ncbi:amidohydrolase family protein [Colwellia sp. RSH04]|uniref:amidohydrolase family protein n=1 Tax=Colwellia sp. RSH04 TaxID=2305464 RepID=UPI000E56E3C7|nr:amidohydrolase family protein [Colwellia sp. RSH04]RHW75368.1 amidohydrolase [Colwellia sp. RSH04]
MKKNNVLISKSLVSMSKCISVAGLIATTALASVAQAESLLITNAEVHTVSSQGILSNASVFIEEGKISAVYASGETPESITPDSTVDAAGRILTPGFIASNNILGLVEVGAVSQSRDASDKKADITFDASLAFNPKSTLIPYTRKGGITSNVVTPHGGEGIFKGQTFIVDLSGEFNSVIRANDAVIVELGSKRKGSRAMALQKLTNTLADAKKAIEKSEKAKDKSKNKEPKRKELPVHALLKGEKLLLAYADRATDILALLKLKKQYQLNLVLVGARDAILVKEDIVAANVPVMTSAIDNLPNSFDSLHGSLTMIAELEKAGVNVILTPSGESHNINQLRYDAGVAIANGLSQTSALAAVTANVADTFKLNSGRISVGKKADLVLWSNDPFEISTKVDAMWINGQKVSTQSRQDALRDRYTTQSDMPRAYTK